MKAKSKILTSIQLPFTLFGLPKNFMAVPVVCALPAYFIPSVLGYAYLSLILALVFGTVSWTVIFLAYRKDHHLETVLFHSFQFWQGRKERWFLAGAHQ